MHHSQEAPRWKRTLTQILIGGLVFQAGFLQAFLAAPSAAASEAAGSAVLNEIHPTDNRVELYNPGASSIAFASVPGQDTGPWLQSSTGDRLSLAGQVLAGGSFWVGTLDLSDEAGSVWLTNTGTDIQEKVSWGADATALLPSPDRDGLARSVDGAGLWLAGAESTLGESNDIAADDVPSLASRIWVAADDENAVSLITSASADDVTIAFEANAAELDHIAAFLLDRNGLVTDLERDLANDLTVEHLNAEELADGLITIRGYTEQNDLKSAWVTGTASKETDDEPFVISQPPAAPTDVRATLNADFSVMLTWNEPANDQDVTGYVIYASRDSVINFSAAPLATVESTVERLSTDILSHGTWSFAVRSKNQAGTQSTNTDAVSVTVASPVFTTKVGAGEAASFITPLGLWLKTSAGASGQTELTVQDRGSQLPGSLPPTGRVFLNQSFDVRADNSSAFPLTVRFFYTSDQLAASGMTESQLDGIYFLDTTLGTWTRYAQTGVNTADIQVEGRSFAGYIFATVDHLTPLAFGADVASPVKPQNLTATSESGQVSLAWNAVSDATGYHVRYRVGTNVDTPTYTTLFLSGKDFTKVTLKNLSNGTLYEFGVAAQDAVGNLSPFAVVEQTPNATTVSTSFVIPTGGQPTAQTPPVAKTTLASTPSTETAAALSQPESVTPPTPEPTKFVPAPAPVGGEAPSDTTEQPSDDGEIKGGTDEADKADSTRTLVTILIIVIAAAAGFGGYYGYQWWVSRPEETTGAGEPTPTSRKKPPRTEGNGRW